jgi:hypothetical protein
MMYFFCCQAESEWSDAKGIPISFMIATYDWGPVGGKPKMRDDTRN